MTVPPEILKYAWQRKLNEVLEDPGGPKRISFDLFLDMLPSIIRMRREVKRAEKAGREPVINSFKPLNPGPYMGVPLGGLGGGTITRGWMGDFVRWQLRPGIYEYNSLGADHFSVYIRRAGQRPRLQTFHPGKPSTGTLAGWAWGLSGEKSTYYALFPRAWTVYKEPDPDLKLTCRQVSPVIPHNYRESSTPAGVFVWTLENSGKEDATVGLMFTFQNGTGGPNDREGGHVNRSFRMEAKGGEVVGVAMQHAYRQPKPLEKGQKPEEQEHFEDPLTFAIAAQAKPGVEVTYRTRFVTNSSGMDLWGDFREGGKLENIEDERPSSERISTGGAVCATVEVPAGETREVAFALAWDMPLARFGEGRAYYRRYTRFYGREGDAAPKIARDALLNYPAWEKQIESWQKPILDDKGLPDWYKSALFNELYYLVDGGTVWTDGEEGKAPPPEGEIGQFAYLEGHEYRMYNTYDVHFYASFALAQLWPELELSLQGDYARALRAKDEEERRLTGSGRKAPRKVKGMIPHDLGAPGEDPWYKVNAATYQDVGLWKDLNPKFVLQVYRDYIATGNKDFVAGVWDEVRTAIGHMEPFDVDEDGLIENDGFPDQTYDTWSMYGPSAYCGGLWLACLSAAAAMADLLGHAKVATKYRKKLKQAQQAYEDILWNEEYYDFDGSTYRQHNSIMADQLAGQWYARACGLEPIVPEEQAKIALQKIYDFNVMKFENGEIGAVNGMRPDGTVDISSLQSQEVWTGVTYALAATMLQESLEEEGFATAEGLYLAGWQEFGYWFMTPEAWDHEGNCRSLGYMRPLAIWAMQWAWERIMK